MPRAVPPNPRRLMTRFATARWPAAGRRRATIPITAPVPPRRFFTLAGMAAALAFGLVWLWVAAAPLAYLDPEYPYWRAKQILVADCDLGDILVLGDSRAAVGIVPSLLPLRTTNLAVGGGKPVEAVAALRRVLACPVPPKRVLISLDAVHFMRPDLFWERSVRFGFLDRADLAEFAALSQETGDWSVHEARQTDGLPPQVRAWLHAVRFPGLYFNSLLKGGILLRWRQNQAGLQAGLASRGQYFFGTGAGSDSVAVEASLTGFRPTPVLDRAFDLLLARLEAAGIPADFVSMPLNETTARATDPAVRAGFAAYLAAYAARYPRFRIIGPVMPAWPDRWFGDGFAHLNPAGAARFTDWLEDCLSLRAAGGRCANTAEETVAARPP
jgi:hypothetical protein